MHLRSLALAAGAVAATRAAKMSWFGINESGAEFGEGTYPGTYGKDYIWYDKSTIDTLISQGVNLFRINFSMERLTPNTLTATPDASYMGNLTDIVTYITGKGKYAMVQPHNYGRFYDEIITDTDGFQSWWNTVASEFVDNDMVIFDTNNEYNTMEQSLVVQLNQAAIDGIRAAGATSQWITPEGNSWTGAWTWESSGNADTMGALTDPQNKLIFQMHQYLDSDGSGTSETCVSQTIMRERLQVATQWLKDNSFTGFLGEFAAGNNADCIAAVKDGLSYMDDNSDVWIGAAWWAAGPWWADYIYNIEPPSGTAYTAYMSVLKDYFDTSSNASSRKF